MPDLPDWPGSGSAVVTDARMGAGFTQQGGIWLPDYAKLAAVEPYVNPYTLWVNISDGSDAAKGNSPGQALATLDAAIAKMLQSAHGGKIVILTASAGNVNLNAPWAIFNPLVIEAINPGGGTVTITYTCANSREVWDAVTTANGTTVNSPTGAFAGGDAAAIVAIYGAGTGGGTYYDFVQAVTDGTHIVVSNAGGTPVARSPAAEALGEVKMAIIGAGDQGRVVTDATIAAGTSLVASPTANFAKTDIGKELVIGPPLGGGVGPGQGGQALRGAITAVGVAGPNTTATITAVATNAVNAGGQCAIGVNFGSALTYHGVAGGGSELRNLTITDTAGSGPKIGGAIEIFAPDRQAGAATNPADLAFENCRLTANGAGSGWSHVIACDGSWNQAGTGPGVRRVHFIGCKFFGSSRPGQTIRLVNAVHWGFEGGGIVGAAPFATAQGIVCLDPQKSAGVQVATEDVNFSGFEGVGVYFYSEGSRTNYTGSLAPSVALAGRGAAHLAPNSKNCSVVAALATALAGVNGSDYDAGTGNRIELTARTSRMSKAMDLYVTNGWLAETFSRNGWGAANASQAIGASGQQVLSLIWLPGGLLISKIGILGAGTALAWGAGYAGQHFQVGLIDPDGNVLCASADAGGTAALAAGVLNSYNMAAAARVPRTGLCAIAILINSGAGGAGFVYPSFGGYATLMNNVGQLLTTVNGAALNALAAVAPMPPNAGGSQSRLYQTVG